jgi:hypothetical protein
VWFLGALGIAVGVVILMSVAFHIAGDEGPENHVASGLRGFFPILAGMVVSFIAQSYRVEERRARLLLAGPLTPRQLAGVTVLLPACFVGLGTLAAGVTIAAESAVTGGFQLATLAFVGGFTGQFWAYAQMGPLAQEATAARRQRRGKAAVFGWAAFILLIPFLAAAQYFFESTPGKLWQAAAALMAMAVAWVLYQGRTDFTR